LHLSIDSTGIKAEGEGEWFAKKHGASKPRQWCKVPLGIDADTLEIRAIEIPGSRVGGAPMRPELLGQIPVDQAIDKVGALLSYDFPMPLDKTGANALHVFAVHWRGGSPASWSLWAARE